MVILLAVSHAFRRAGSLGNCINVFWPLKKRDLSSQSSSFAGKKQTTGEKRTQKLMPEIDSAQANFSIVGISKIKRCLSETF